MQEGAARAALLVKEALKEAEAEANQVRLSAVQMAAEAVASHWQGELEGARRAWHKEKEVDLQQAMEAGRAEARAEAEETLAALRRSHEVNMHTCNPAFRCSTAVPPLSPHSFLGWRVHTSMHSLHT